MTDLHLPENEAAILRLLSEWEISGMGLHPGGSNYVFVVRLEDPERVIDDADNEESGQADIEVGEEDPEGAVYAIYKPSAGERPLRDFPYGTLHRRERAAYLLSLALGWPDVPATVIRDGPHGEGSVQLFIDADTQANYFTLRDECLHLFEPVATFDVLVHNADRKGGSCLQSDADGRIWAIDHGLTFNPSARRRTVMFEFNGREYEEKRLADIERVVETLNDGESPLRADLTELLEEQEIEGLARRGERMVRTGRFPLLDPNVNVPWPFI